MRSVQRREVTTIIGANSIQLTRGLVKERARQADCLVDPREVMFLFALLVAYGLAIAILDEEDYWIISVVGSSALAIILSTAAWWRVKRNSRAIWQPLFWFRIACAAYYGVGALAPHIANEYTLLYIRALYPFSDGEVLKVSVINLLSILLVLSTALFIAPKHVWRGLSLKQSTTQFNTFRFAILMLIIGGVSWYIVVLPWTFGLVEDVPGIAVPLAKSYNIGLYLIVLAGMRGSRLAIFIACILIPIDLLVSSLTFGKNHVLLTLIFVCLGVLHDRLSLPRALIGLTLVFGVYSQLDPVFHYGRDQLKIRNGTNKGSFQERLAILSEYMDAERQGLPKEQLQSWLLRLSYVNAETMVVSWYDVGRPGDSLKDAFIVLVPRIIWPDKPEITAVGANLYQTATGQEGSYISPGLFGEAYWNFGWIGIPLLMVPLGALLAAFSYYSLRVMSQDRLIHLPSVLLGLVIGYRVDGWYVADVIGGSAIALVYIASASFFEIFLIRRSAWPSHV